MPLRAEAQHQWVEVIRHVVPLPMLFRSPLLRVTALGWGGAGPGTWSGCYLTLVVVGYGLACWMGDLETAVNLLQIQAELRATLLLTLQSALSMEKKMWNLNLNLKWHAVDLPPIGCISNLIDGDIQ